MVLRLEQVLHQALWVQHLAQEQLLAQELLLAPVLLPVLMVLLPVQLLVAALTAPPLVLELPPEPELLLVLVLLAEQLPVLQVVPHLELWELLPVQVQLPVLWEQLRVLLPAELQLVQHQELLLVQHRELPLVVLQPEPLPVLLPASKFLFLYLKLKRQKSGWVFAFLLLFSVGLS